MATTDNMTHFYDMSDFKRMGDNSTSSNGVTDHYISPNKGSASQQLFLQTGYGSVINRDKLIVMPTYFNSITVPSPLKVDKDFTISFSYYMREDDEGNPRGFFLTNDDGNTRQDDTLSIQFHPYYDSEDDIVMFLYDNNDDYTKYTSSEDYPEDLWVHYTFVREGNSLTDNTIKIYTNGELIKGISNITFRDFTFNEDMILKFGGNNSTTGNNYTSLCLMSDIKVWGERALTTQEVRNLFVQTNMKNKITDFRK